MKILIIGSEGFIGSNAVHYFRRLGYRVFSADIVLKEEQGYSIINPELADFKKLFDRQQYDICLNASGVAKVQFSFNDPLLDFTLNTANVFNILEAIRQYNVDCKFINISSAAVYGNPKYLPIDENHPLNPVSPYGWHKLYSEKICTEYANYFGIATLSIRVFSAYGPGLKKQLFWDLYQKSLSFDTIELFGTGNETRDFIYIDDLLLALKLIIENADFKGEVINVANNFETSVRDAALTFLDIIGFKGKLVFNNMAREGDPLRWRADISKLQKLGYHSQVDLVTGLNKYFQWIKESK